MPEDGNLNYLIVILTINNEKNIDYLVGNFSAYSYLFYNIPFFDTIYAYENAWKKEDSSFFIEKVGEIYSADTTKVLNTLARISDVSDCYIIESGEFDNEKKMVKDFGIYKQNIVFGLTIYFTRSNLFNEKKIDLSMCRKYEDQLSIEEKYDILKIIE